MGPLADTALTLGAALRLARFLTTDTLGEWLVVAPAREWAGRAEQAAEHAAGGPAADGWPRSWQARAVEGLECPFCVPFWVGGLLVAGTALLPADRLLGRLWRVALTALALNYVVGHVSSRLDT